MLQQSMALPAGAGARRRVPEKLLRALWVVLEPATFGPRWLLSVLWAILGAVLSRVGAWLGAHLWRAWVSHKRRVILSDWMELEFAPWELRAERQTVLCAVKQDWRALEFASEALREDGEVV